MTGDNKIENSLIPNGPTSLVKVGNSIEITNKILKENEERNISELIEYINIGDQAWMIRNLDVDCYANGDPIPQVQNPKEWQGLKSGAWCYYNNDLSNGEKYGKLYNWYAINDERGLAPIGYHVPSDKEFTVLVDSLGISAGAKMKSNSSWEENGNGTNESGFTSLPGGILLSNGFNYFGESCYMWSSTQKDKRNAYYLKLNYDHEFVIRIFQYKECGMSVRCIRD